MTNRKERAAEYEEVGYTVNIVGRNVLVTEAMKNHAIEKLLKLERFSDRIIDIQVTMDIQKVEHRVDIVMKVGHMLIKSHASSDDIYASIDKAVDKLQAQLRRYKTKLRDHTAKPLEIVDMHVNVIHRLKDKEIDELNDAIEEETNKRRESELKPHEIVSRETMSLKQLTTDEAIMKMDLSGHQFLLYKNEVTRKLNLIYRRSDGNYGVILPEG